MRKQHLRIEQEQVEKLMELGTCLRQFRYQQDLSLEQVAAKTLIPVRTLNALEEGNMEQLPEPVYVQGFIRRYADAIGMNGAELADAFPTSPLVSPPRNSWRLSLIQPQLRPVHLYLLYMVLVASAVSGLSYLLNRSSSPVVGVANRVPQALQTSNDRTLPSSGGPVVGPPAPTAQPSASVQGEGNAPLSSGALEKPVRVGLKLTDQSWIRVVADGKTEFEGVLQQGTQRTWMANRQLTVRAGNAGGVLVSFNDGQAKPMGTPGSVEEVTFGSNPSATRSADGSIQKTLTASRSRVF